MKLIIKKASPYIFGYPTWAMYRKSDDFSLDFGQIMVIENLKNNFY
jgi:hypothetical protein